MQILVVKFASMCGATVTKFWKPNVTHVIAATDAQGACTRTLKVLMAILNGRWILKIDCKLIPMALMLLVAIDCVDHCCSSLALLSTRLNKLVSCLHFSFVLAPLKEQGYFLFFILTRRRWFYFFIYLFLGPGGSLVDHIKESLNVFYSLSFA